MKNKASIIKFINKLTDKIGQQNMEMYRFLERKPVEIPVEKKIPTITKKVLKLYHHTLKFFIKKAWKY